ncbi:hypothetical protein DEU56DRAFT_783179 [Suillus clintonianus]|uniref:uncharacterized protein n=1 Tax=Suillus clintonianus TaxID=1904413 RepID=UPI001B873830|nr:uncharacterized protein DEU56DRAFT_783179 [Suillus clintonianus]KAG2147925.1 hypothetical protein DEU56DRAFT_783179 [Suillus clintonianus]
MNPSSRPASSSTRPAVSPNSRPQVNTHTKVLDTTHGRILCIADIRGRLSGLNDLAREANAKAIIHTGDFGFFESNSLERINDRTLRHLTMYSPLIPSTQRTHFLAPDNTAQAIRATVDISLLSEFPLLLSGQLKLSVPVYTVWGACEDVVILEKFRGGIYNIDNLHVLDEATTHCLDVGGVKLRLLGLGGALVPHKMFDNGDGSATIAGGQGTMWTTALQIGELVDTAQRVFDPTETRLLVTHASPGREGIMAQLALVLKADLSISAGLHFRYASSYNEFSVQSDLEGFRHKLIAGKESFDKVWDSVKQQVETVIDEHQRVLLDKALSVVERVPNVQGPEEPSWKNCWNWNLCDAAFGSLVLDVKDGRISAELRSQGFNYAYRRTAAPNNVAPTPNSTTSSLPNATSNPPTKGSTPVQAEKPLSPHQKEVRSPLAPVTSGKETPKEPSPSTPAPKSNGSGTPAPSSDKAEKEKQKRKEKKERKDRERAEAKEKEASTSEEKTDPAVNTPAPAPASASAPTPVSASPAPASEPKSGKATPEVPIADVREGMKSPTTDSTGARTPTSKRPPRHPWTLFVKLPQESTEADVRTLFGGDTGGVTKVTFVMNKGSPLQRARPFVYVEFGDDESMKAGLNKNDEKMGEGTVSVQIATEREERNDRAGGRGGPRGRGGRGGRGGFAARGFAAAGLTQRGTPRTNGEARESAAA